MNFLFIKGIIFQFYKIISLAPTYIKFNKNPDKYSLDDKFKVVKNYAEKSLVVAKTNVNVTGYDNLPKGNVLFVANHANWGDAFILLSIVDRPCGMIIAKEANWDRIPLIGGWTQLINCLHLDRKNNRNALKTINEGINILKYKSSIGVFPEGIVTNKDEIYDFKDGAFRMAIKSQVPVVPICIKNSKDMFHMTSRWTGNLNPTNIDVEILSPIYNHIGNPKIKSKDISSIARYSIISAMNQCDYSSKAM